MIKKCYPYYNCWSFGEQFSSRSTNFKLKIQQLPFGSRPQTNIQISNLRANSPFTQNVKKFEKDPPGLHETMRTPIASYLVNLKIQLRKLPQAGSRKNWPNMPIRMPVGGHVLLTT